MGSFALIVVGLIPSLFLLWLYYKKDRLEPEPIGQVARIFAYGALAALPAAAIEYPLGPAGWLPAVAVSPVVEESLKFAVVWVFIYHHPEFDEPMDGIVYAAAAALGFAAMENLLFLGGVNAVPEHLPVLFSGVSGALAPGLAFGVHSVLSVPGHALWSSIWGYALGRAKFMAARLPAVRGAALALMAAWALHGLHNGLTMLSPIYGTIGLAVLALVLWQWVRRNIAAALRDSPFAEPIAVAPEGADLPGVAD